MVEKKKVKIIIWLGNNTGYFGIAKKILEKFPCELFAIIDYPNNSKKFFEKQNLIKFSKKWYFHDEIQKTTEVDYKYLEKFENTYKINLWKIIYSDRFFNKYNRYYNFTKKEILMLIQEECKFFETVLKEINPEFVIIKMTETHQDFLFHEICVAKNIKILTAGAVRFSGRTIISSEIDKIDNTFEGFSESNKKQRTFEELQMYMKGYTKDVKTLVDKSGISLVDILRMSIKYIKMINNKNFRMNFESKGKTPKRVIFQTIKRIIKKKIINSYLEKNAIKSISENQFIYFPLHYEPERNLSIGAPFYENQIEVIINIAKNLPVNYKLFVKDHPLMEKIGMRDIETYKKISRLPNVELINQSMSNEELLKKCSLLITVAGTSGLEAAFYGKPSIVFSDVIYTHLPSVFRLNGFEELEGTIKKALKTNVKIEELNKYVEFIENNSFEFDFMEFTKKSVDVWYGNIIEDMNISEDVIKKHLKEFDSKFDILALEFIKKIK